MNVRHSAAGTLVVTGLLLVGCSTGQVAVPPKITVSQLSASKLQFGVGTATIGTNPDPNTGLPYVKGVNFVATFRAPDGNNPATDDTPTLTAPAAMNFGMGNHNVLAGASQSTLAALLKANTPLSPQAFPQIYSTASFGLGTGVFGYGLALNPPLSPAVSVTLQNAGGGSGSDCPQGFAAIGGGSTAASSFPIVPEPLYQGGCPFATSPNVLPPGTAFYGDEEFPFTYIGGPPAWPPAQGYNNFANFLGYPIGFFDVAVPPVAGTYSLDVAVPSSADYSTNTHFDANATLTATRASAFLPVFPQPTLTLNGDGSGTISIVVPAGVTETIVFVNTSTSCDFLNTASNYYTIVTHAPGAQTLLLSSLLGAPNAAGQPTHTFCTPSDAQAYKAAITAGGGVPQPSESQFINISAVGFDYPAYEASYPQNTSQTPKITNAQGTADLTASHPFSTTNTVTAP